MKLAERMSTAKQAGCPYGECGMVKLVEELEFMPLRNLASR